MSGKVMKEKDLPSVEKLSDTANNTLTTAWNINSLHQEGINRWLDNFVGDALLSDNLNREKAKELERKIALFLLCNFTYYNEDEVRYLMKLMLVKYIHYYATSLHEKYIDESRIDLLIRDTVFSPLGNQSESSAYMLYLFRQINELSKTDFVDKPESKRLVYVDDFSITGAQAELYIMADFKAHPEHKEKEIYVLLMVATRDAVERIKNISEVVDVFSCVLMDESSKVFSDSSIVFKGYKASIKESALTMCQYYGEKLVPDEDREYGGTPLGFGGGGYLFGAYYNTPNNTLPIFWSEKNSWEPLFMRFDKKYKSDNGLFIGGRYV